jgi:hypothetical protein
MRKTIDPEFDVKIMHLAAAVAAAVNELLKYCAIRNLNQYYH